MSKLFKLKEWVTLPGAAKHLSSILDEESVSVADVLRLGLDGHLTLSVNFVNKVRARCGKAVPISEARLLAFSAKEGKILGPVASTDLRANEPLPNNITDGVKSGSIVLVRRGIDIGKEQVLELRDEITTLEGVWDLPMIGAERLDVEHMFQQETDGPEVTLTCLDGPFVASQSGEICQLQEHVSQNEYSAPAKTQFSKKDGPEPRAERPANKALSIDDPNSYYPAPSLPTDSVVVVRTGALADLENRIAENAMDRPVAERERATLLTIIAALANFAKVDWTKTSKAGDVIEGLALDINARVPSRTIQEHLKRIPDALERRSND